MTTESTDTVERLVKSLRLSERGFVVGICIVSALMLIRFFLSAILDIQARAPFSSPPGIGEAFAQVFGVLLLCGGGCGLMMGFEPGGERYKWYKLKSVLVSYRLMMGGCVLLALSFSCGIILSFSILFGSWTG